MEIKNGFTMIELIIVVVLLGIISVVAIPRLVNTQQFNDRGTVDRVEFLLKTGAKLAASQRRSIYVIKSGTNLNLCYQNTSPCPATQSVNANGTSFTVGLGSTSITLPGTLSFNSFGNTGTTLITIPVGSKTLYIEQDSGYVHQ